MRTSAATIGPHPTDRARQPLEEAAGGQRRPALRLLTFELPRARMPFSMLCVGMLVAGLIAVLVINILISQTSFRIDQLGAEKAALAQQKDRLIEDNSYRESPQNIAAAAEKQGLVRDTSPQFLDLATGEIIEAPPIDVNGEKKPTAIPGPRADARDDLRPNLRSDEKLPVVGGNRSKEIASPAQIAPK